MPTKKLNLILIPEKRMADIGDFLKIADLIRDKCADVIPHVVKRNHAAFKQALYLARPTLYVGFYDTRKFQPWRGTYLHGLAMTKSEQYRQIEKSGLQTLQWKLIEPGIRYAPADWGSHVIVKPDEGRQGHDVKIRKTGRVRYEKDCLNDEAHIIQKFIHTGAQPVNYRALTFFGETIYMHKSTNTACGNLLTDPNRIDELGGHNPVATAAHGKGELVIDEEIIAYARQVALTAFRDIPLLGQDIIRDIHTGKLYCLEVNPYGSTWHFSSASGHGIQTANNFNFEEQFGAFNKVADILIQKTREFAV